MRLYELIDFTPRITSKPSVRRAGAVSKLNNYDFKGAGSFGSTYAVPSHKRLNQITKVGRAGYVDKDSFRIRHASDPIQDGYLAYINEIYKLEQDGEKNPYFPVIHDLKIFKDDDGRLSYNLNMERLHDFTKPSIVSNTDLLQSLAENMFVQVPDMIGFDADYIIKTIREAAKNNRYDNIADRQLRKALRLIHRIHVNAGRVIDLHSGNVMWRITGTMPQLVITDPLA